MVFQPANLRSLAQRFSYRLRILSCNFQQCLSWPTWFSSTLFPVLQGRYTYPYHQAIGFYLERSGGYSQSQLDLLRQFDIQYDFYLAHQMKEMDYNEKWRLFIPKGF